MIDISTFLYGTFTTLFALVVWEKESTQRKWRFIPSSAIEWVVETSHKIGTALGKWIARFTSVWYFISKFVPFLKPYGASLIRLLRAILPRSVPGYHFLKGFFSESYGYMASVVLGVVCGLGGVWWLDALPVVPIPASDHLVWKWVASYMFTIVVNFFLGLYLGEEYTGSANRRVRRVNHPYEKRAVFRPITRSRRREMDSDTESDGLDH